LSCCQENEELLNVMKQGIDDNKAVLEKNKKILGLELAQQS